MALGVTPLAASPQGGVGVVEGAHMGQVTYYPEPEGHAVSEMGDVADIPLATPADPRQGQSAHHPQWEVLPLSCCRRPTTAALVLCGTAAACLSSLLSASHALLKPSQEEYHVSLLVAAAAVAAAGGGGGWLPGVIPRPLAAESLDGEALAAEVLLLGASLHVKHAPDSGGGAGLAWESAFHPD